MEEVREIAGSPQTANEVSDGTTVWCYQVWSNQGIGIYSDAFAITFDREDGVVIDRNY